MTDQELIKALRHCYGAGGCKDCVYEQGGMGCIDENPAYAADRLEALLAENEALNERDKAHKELKQALERKCTALTVQNELLRGLKAGKDTNVPTLAQHIRAMNDFELMEFLWRLNTNAFESVIPFCKSTPECDELLDSSEITDEMCKRCLLEKLLQPYDSASL